MHLVGLGLEPVEEALHAVPAAGLPEFLEVFRAAGTTISVVDPVAHLFVEVLPRRVDVDAALLAVADQVALAFVAALALEGFDRALLDAEGGIGDGLFEVEADHPAEAAALGAGAERVVEGEEGGGGRAEGVAGGGVGPGRAEGAGDGRLGVGNGRSRGGLRQGGRRHGGVAFAEGEGVFEGFEEAGAVGFGEGESVLDDVD